MGPAGVRQAVGGACAQDPLPRLEGRAQSPGAAPRALGGAGSVFFLLSFCLVIVSPTLQMNNQMPKDHKLQTSRSNEASDGNE